MRIQSINSVNYANNYRNINRVKNNSQNNINPSIISYPNINYLSFGQVQKVNAVKKMNPELEAILNEYKNLPQVQSVAIGGSSASNYADKSSDIDVYIFTKEDIPVETRKDIAKKYSQKMDIGQDYFGPDDEYFADKLGKAIDVVYFSTKQMEDNIKSIWENHNASNGYTTCFLYTLKTAKTFSDKDGWLQGLKDRINTPYPKELKQNIINRNMQLLKDKPFASYQEQVRKAVQRNDLNSVNHRVAAYMASYFDIIFAKNELLHPGEKRLVKYALDNCRVLPDEFEENIHSLYTESYKDIPYTLNDMTEKLRACL